MGILTSNDPTVVPILINGTSHAADMAKARADVSMMPERGSKEPREYVREMSEFAIELEKSVVTMPRDMNIKIVRHFFELIQYEFWQFIISPSVSLFNRAGARGLLIDLNFVVEAASRISVKGTQEVLLELQQLLTLIVSEHVKEFVDSEEFRQRHYPKLTNYKLMLSVVLKFKESGNFVNRLIFQDDHFKAIEALTTFLRSRQ